MENFYFTIRRQLSITICDNYSAERPDSQTYKMSFSVDYQLKNFSNIKQKKQKDKKVEHKNFRYLSRMLISGSPSSSSKKKIIFQHVYCILLYEVLCKVFCLKLRFQ